MSPPPPSIQQQHITRATNDSEVCIHFYIKNASQIGETVISAPTFVRRLPWHLTVTPGQRIAGSLSLGFTLWCTGPPQSVRWSCNAAAELRLHSFLEDVQPIVRHLRHPHRFSATAMWSEFAAPVSWEEILDDCFVDDDTIGLELVLVVSEPEGVAKDSKSMTGFVGMVNLGATCYVNSVLQTLFCTNQLRKAVYQLPTGSEDSATSMGLGLQRVFCDLQRLDRPVRTRELTRCFGWQQQEALAQHDVQEFLRLLLGLLEQNMERTAVAGTVQRLFQGTMSTYIRCKNVNHHSKRQEPFYDIQLNVKGLKNVAESLLDYIKPETLDGANLYDAGEHGMQPADKGVIFVSFPPVLHLHLKRFEYDNIAARSVKCNDRFEFDVRINLDAYLQQPLGPGVTPADYTLQAVLVHRGGSQRGHYVVYIDPQCDGHWYKFDDAVVSRCSQFEAIQQNYGGTAMHSTYGFNAYMLVYVRDSDMATVLQPIGETDVPARQSDRMDEEERRRCKRRYSPPAEGSGGPPARRTDLNRHPRRPRA